MDPLASSLKSPIVLITRPKAMAHSLTQAIEARGYTTVHLPTVRIAACPLEPLDNNQPPFAITIFTSTNAVEHGHDLLSKYDYLGQIMAIGQTTHRALSRHQIGPIITPTHQFSSEGLLAMPELKAHSVQGKRILIVCGHQPRNHLSVILEQRGADVTLYPVYQRCMPAPNIPSTLKNFPEKKIHSIVFYSVSSLQNFVQLTQQNHLSYFHTPIIVISQRIAQAAHELGFTSIFDARSVVDEAVIAALARISDSLATTQH